jgi:hypothetical protein
MGTFTVGFCCQPLDVKAIANIAHGLNNIGLAGVGLDFLPERQNMRINGAGVIDGIGPGPAQQIGTAEGSPAAWVST